MLNSSYYCIQKEEKTRLEKLKNLEKYGSKLGKSHKLLVAENSSEAQAELPKKKKDKPKLRPGDLTISPFIYSRTTNLTIGFSAI